MHILENDERIKSLSKEIESFRKEKVEINGNFRRLKCNTHKMLSGQTLKQSGRDRGKKLKLKD